MRAHGSVLTVALILLACGDLAAQPDPLVVEGPGGQSAWSADLEYVVWWIRRGRVPPVLTTGPAGSRGLLGQDGTRVVYDDHRVETRHNDRFIGTRLALQWRDECGVGVEARAFFLERDSTYKKYASDGSQLLAVPYFNNATGQQDGVIVAGDNPARGPVSGRFVGYTRIEWFGEELNAVFPLAEAEGGRLDLLAGGRSFQMRDRFHYTATSEALPRRDVLVGFFDNYRVGNTFVGGQLGVKGEAWWEGLFAQGRATAALGADYQKVRTFGRRVTQTTAGRTEEHRGLFVQGPAAGRFTRWHLDGAAEVAANVGWAVTENVRLLAGYTLLCWFDPLRAGDQVNPATNVRTGPATGRPPFRGDTLWAHGVNMGVELRW